MGAFAALGLAGVIAGLFALRYCLGVRTDRLWKSLRAASYLLGAVLAACSYALRGHLSYAGDGPDGPGTVIGIPFFVAFTDASGAGGVTFLTVPLALLNAVFWFLLPQLPLAAFALMQRNKR
ncbi:MAG: hypothetical protein HY017_14045 [Betaproteobacteria bacterium]|nr:hypothetical protein [Betaproteobacteria bacterium]